MINLRNLQTTIESRLWDKMLYWGTLGISEATAANWVAAAGYRLTDRIFSAAWSLAQDVANAVDAFNTLDPTDRLARAEYGYNRYIPSAYQITAEIVYYDERTGRTSRRQVTLDFDRNPTRGEVLQLLAEQAEERFQYRGGILARRGIHLESIIVIELYRRTP